MKKNTLIRLFYILFSTVLLAPSFAEPPNLTLVRLEVVAYHDTGAYQRDLTAVINQAHRFILDQINANSHRAQPKRLAVVLDIDETSLSNYDKFVRHQFVETRAQIHHDMLAANSPVIEPTLKLYNDAIKHGVAIFFVTGRHESERFATVKNLKKAGYNQWTALYLRPNVYNQPSIIPFKSQTRKHINEQGYTIIASIGDQYSDLKGGYAEKTFKLPNPYYYLP